MHVEKNGCGKRIVKAKQMMRDLGVFLNFERKKCAYVNIRLEN